ncbi:MAG: zinc ribbon domain-containing protein [Syntrophus sp. (in: bacteria)]|nr:zinc ribbon domain-containing protein [Syntrophus sp. (in: bacteria)]
MPTYDYRCQKCNRKFSVKHSIAEYGKAKVDCPKCKSKNVKQQISLFIAKTSRKS